MAQPSIVSAWYTNTQDAGNLTATDNWPVLIPATTDCILSVLYVGYPANASVVTAYFGGTAKAAGNQLGDEAGTSVYSSHLGDSSDGHLYVAVVTPSYGSWPGSLPSTVTFWWDFTDGGGANGGNAVATYSNVSQAAPIKSATTGADLANGDTSISVTDATTNDIIIDLLSLQATSSGAYTIAQAGTTGRTSRYSYTGSAFLKAGIRGFELAGDGATKTIAWTAGTGFRGGQAIALTLQGSVGAGGGGAPTRGIPAVGPGGLIGPKRGLIG